MWLEVGKTEDCMMDAMCKETVCGWSRGDRGLFDGRNVSGARMSLEVGETEDCMMDAMCKEPRYGWR